MTPDALLSTFHERVRLATRDADLGHVVEQVGPVRRWYPPDRAERGAMVESPEGVGEDPDATIAQQRDFFAARGQAVEWKTYGYDEPADLGTRLEAAGFVPEEVEALILGDAEVVADAAPELDGVVVRAVEDDADVERIADLHELVWPGTRGITHSFGREWRQRPDLTMGCLVEETRDGPVLCASWLRLVPDSGFGGLWGGATHPQWRQRGFYRATVAHRARLALDAGYPWLRVDASPFSRPVLERLGLHQVSTTTPYVFTPGS